LWKYDNSTSNNDHSGLWIALVVIGVLLFLAGTVGAVFLFKRRQKDKEKELRWSSIPPSKLEEMLRTFPRKSDMIFQLSGVQILEKIGEGNSFFFIWWNVC
jgi:hypothetical protein